MSKRLKSILVKKVFGSAWNCHFASAYNVLSYINASFDSLSTLKSLEISGTNFEASAEKSLCINNPHCTNSGIKLPLNSETISFVI